MTETISPPKNVIARYATALGFTLIALAMTASIGALRLHHAFDLFQAAVFMVAWFEGIGPALLASALSILLIDYFFIPPLHTLMVGTTDIFRLAIFGAVAILTSSLSARLRRTQFDLQHAHDQLEQRVLERTEQLSQANAHLEEEVTQRRVAEREILQISSREQRRLGEDLHDGLCQTLAGLRLLSQELKTKLTSKNLPWIEDVERIEARLGDALTEADIVSRGLYPVELETDGLMEALEELSRKISMLYRVRCDFKSPAPVFIADSSTATHLYRIAQEAINNAIKRGKAKRIRVRLSRQGDQTTLSILDDGIGLQKPPVRKGMGLKMMAYRARMINATLNIRSRARGVTRVTCTLSMESKEELPNDGHQTHSTAR